MKHFKTITLLVAILTLSSFKAGERVLFIGDSLTCYKGGWQDQVCAARGYEKLNLSRGGKRTAWMLETLKYQLESNSNYDKVYIYGGCNDAYSHVKLTEAVGNIQQMVYACLYYRIEPVVVIGYDPSRVMTKTTYPDSVTRFHRDRYVKLQKMMAEQLEDCKIVPMDTTVTKADAHDGIHLGARGQKKFADWVLTHTK